MPSRVKRAAVLWGVLTLAAGCATAEQWGDWRGHPTHFASGKHASFSFRNTEGATAPHVRRSDIEASRAETWWGKAITVNPEQIFQNG